MAFAPMGGINAGLAGASQATSLATSSIINSLTPEGQALNRQAEDDIRRLRLNSFGPSEAEQERMVEDQLAQARAVAAGQIAEQQRLQAASGGGRQPDSTKAKIVEAQMKQAGQARMQAANIAGQLAAQARREALARVKERSDKTVADVRSIRDEGHDAYMESGGSPLPDDVSGAKIDKSKMGV